jgi:hypothetical protein
MKKLAKIPYEVGKKTVGSIRKMGVKGTANATMNVATGATLVSMIPTTAGTSTDKDIDRMKQYQSQRGGDGGGGDGRRQTADGSREIK